MKQLPLFADGGEPSRWATPRPGPAAPGPDGQLALLRPRVTRVPGRRGGVGVPYAPESASSRAAAVAMRPALSRAQAAVLRALAARADGMTDQELNDALGKRGTGNPRRCELARWGLVRDTGRRRHNPGRVAGEPQATVWEITASGRGRLRAEAGAASGAREGGPA